MPVIAAAICALTSSASSARRLRRSSVTSASSSNHFPFRGLLPGRVPLLEVLVLRAAVIVTRPTLDLRRRQQPLRLDDRTLAVDPLRLDRIEPRTLARQWTDHDAQPTFTLRPAVVLL